MAILLGTVQVQGQSQALSQTPDDPTEVIVIPEEACWPAHVSIDNTHATANIYCKWVPLGGTKGSVSSTDHSRRLKAGEGYVWDSPPRNARLIAIADAASVQLRMDANWSLLRAQGAPF